MIRLAENVGYNEEFIVNTRGMKLFTCKWFPINQEPKALIFFCHGYAMECSTTMDSVSTKLAKQGFAVHGIDYEGHGKSDGLPAFIESFNNLVDDVSSHFSNIAEMGENVKKMRLLMGESMGGAVALLLHRKKPGFWDGAVLLAPMCKIADDVKPPPMVLNILQKISNLLPTWKSFMVSGDIVDAAFKLPQVRQQIRENQYCYKGRLRLKTGSELFRVSNDLELRLHEVTFPFIVLHGEDDKVTDAKASKKLHEVASSKDKTIKLYLGMWHSLLIGEPQENVEIVLADIVQWLDERTAEGNERLGKGLNDQNDNKGPKAQL